MRTRRSHTSAAHHGILQYVSMQLGSTLVVLPDRVMHYLKLPHGLVQLFSMQYTWDGWDHLHLLLATTTR